MRFWLPDDFEKEKKRMLKMRMMFGLIAVVMVLALAQSGYSQLVISATSSPNPTADVVGFTEPTYNPNNGYSGVVITGTILSDAPFTGGRLRITYPSSITNACTVGTSSSSTGCSQTFNGPGVNVPGIAPGVGFSISSTTGVVTNGNINTGVQLTLANGIFTGAAIASINGPAGTLDITMPCANSANLAALAVLWNGTGATHIQGASGTLILTGVRIDATTAAGLPTGPAAAALSLNTSSTGIPNSNVGVGGGTTAPNIVECAGSTGGGTNVQLNTTTMNVVSATAPGIGAVAIGGIPSSVSTPSSTNAVGSGVGTQTTTWNSVNVCNNAGFNLSCGVATIYTNKNIPKGLATFTVKEGFNYAWYHNDASQFNGQDLSPGGGLTTNDAAFQLIFNNVPTGVTLTLQVASFTGTNNGTSAASAPGLSNSTITTANNTTVIKWNGDLSPTSTDWVTIQISNITVSNSATLSPGNITVSAQMWPTQPTALNLTNGNGQAVAWAVGGTAAFPIFAPSVVTGPSVVSIVPANTTLLIPFAVAQGAFDTGIALANTSADPFSGLGATPQSGTVTVNLFPSTATGAGTSVNFTTSATKLAGTGIAADGTIPAGATWTVNLSQLLPLAGQTGGFIGYIFIQANFLPAHGAAYVYNGTGFTSSTPVLVLPPPSTNGRNGNFANGAESLDF
jgi:hypothetical protein